MSILKGEFREVVHCGVSHLLNRENSVAQFESWEDVGRGTSGAMSGHRTCRGVPITQDELDTHYRALKKHTSLTKAKIGSGKVLFKDLREPIVVEYQGKVYMAAPFVPDTSVPDTPATWLPKPPSVAPPLTPKELLTRARELGKDAYGYGFGMHTHTQDLTLSVLCHNPEQEPSLVVKMIEAWKKGWQAEQKAATKPPRTPAPSVPAILTPAPPAAEPAAKKAAATPKFKTVEDAERWLEKKYTEHGGRWKFQATPEYKKVEAHLSDLWGKKNRQAEKERNQVNIVKYPYGTGYALQHVKTTNVYVGGGAMGMATFETVDKAVSAAKRLGFEIMSKPKATKKERDTVITSDFTAKPKPKAPKPKPRKADKEPWEIPRREYVSGYAGASAMHQASVRFALSKGYKVPAKVLKDYPDLVKTQTPPAASDMASVPVRLGGGGIPPIPGMGVEVTPKPKRKTAAKPAAKPAKKAAAPKPKSKAKNGKTATGITLTAAQKKRLAAKGSITIKRDGKFVTVRG